MFNSNLGLTALLLQIEQFYTGHAPASFVTVAGPKPCSAVWEIRFPRIEPTRRNHDEKKIPTESVDLPRLTALFILALSKEPQPSLLFVSFMFQQERPITQVSE